MMDYELNASGAQPRSDMAGRPTRILHAMIRVLDLQRSLEFYIGALGMRLLRRQDYPAGRFTLAFLGYAAEESSTVLELTHNWDQVEPYAIGTAYGHIAIAVNDIYSVCGNLADADVSVIRPPGPMKHSATLIAFIEDPDGIVIELVQRD